MSKILAATYDTAAQSLFIEAFVSDLGEPGRSVNAGSLGGLGTFDLATRTASATFTGITAPPPYVTVRTNHLNPGSDTAPVEIE